MLVRVQVPLSAPYFNGAPISGPLFFTWRNSIRGTNRPSLLPRSIAARARARFAVQIAPLSACHTGDSVGVGMWWGVNRLAFGVWRFWGKKEGEIVVKKRWIIG